LCQDSCVISEFGDIAVHIYKVAVISLMKCKKVVMKCVLFHVMKEHSHDFKSVVMLQMCMGLIKDEPDSGSESCVTTLDNGTEEGNRKVEDSLIKVKECEIKFDESDREVEAADIKVEELIDIKEENPEAIKFPPIKTEPEVSVWELCVRQQLFMLHRTFTATK